ncbi:MAG: outer membrane beta-barrel protein [Owenweeksia sp.]
MKNIIATTASFVLMCTLALAQPAKDSVEVAIEGNQITLRGQDLQSLSEMDLNRVIREVVEKTTKLQKQQQELIARVEEQRKRGEITEEQAEEMKETIYERTEDSMEVISELMETWGEAYGERWEAWAEEYERKMEVWEAQMEAQAEAQEGAISTIPPVPPLPPLPEAPTTEQGKDKKGKQSQRIIISDDGIIIQDGEDDDEPFALRFKEDEEVDTDPDREHEKIDRTETYFDINFGFNQLLEDGQFFVYDEPGEQNFWKSTVFELGIGGKTRIGNPYSKFYFKWGANISWHNFRLYGDNILVKGATRSSFIEDTNSYTESKFEITYLNVPLMLQLDLSDVGDMDEAFTFGLGGYVGFRIHSERELEFNDFEGEEVEEERENDFFTNPVRYGLIAQIGWENLKLTAKYDLNSFFQSGKGPLNFENLPANYQMASVTIGLSLP